MKRILLLFMCAGICFFVVCSKFRNDNPLSGNYSGDYRINVKRGSIPDTLQVFKQYALVCSTGADSFASYHFSSAVSGFLIVDSVNVIRKKKVDVIYFYCGNPFSGKASLEGMRPNHKADSVLVDLLVINSYRIEGKNSAVAGEPDSLKIGYGGAAGGNVDSLRVIWEVRPGTKESILPITSAFVFAPAAVCTVSARIINHAGVFCSLESFPVSMINAKRPVLGAVELCGKASLGAPLKVIIKSTGADTSSYKAYISLGNWSDTSSQIHPAGTDTAIFNRPVSDTGTQTFTVYVKNTAGLKSNEMTLQVSIAYVLPKVSFTADTLVFSINDLFPVTVSSNPEAARYVWQIDTQQPETTSSRNKDLLLSDTLLHTLKVFGIDGFGYRGEMDSVPIKAKKFACRVVPKEFPSEAKVKGWTRWIAGVNDENRAKKVNAKYAWALSSNNYDSMKISGASNDTLRLLWLDTAHVNITLTVNDDSGGGCASYVKGIAVRRFAPRLAFKERVFSMKTTDSIVCAVSVVDSNADGSVDSIFWTRGGKSPAIYKTRDSVLTVKSVLPDTFWINAYALDNDGFLSNRDSARFMVKAFRPYILPQPRDTVVFVNSPITFSVSGQVSDSSTRIAMYYWDFDGNGSWEDSSSSSTIVHTFATVGTFSVIVKCKDNKEVASIPDTFKVTVTKGEPSVAGIAPRTVWFGENVVYTLSASTRRLGDTIVGYYMSWNNSDSFAAYLTKSFNYAFADTGKHIVKLYVRSKDGLVSETRPDTIYVNPDKPIIDSIKLEAPAGALFVNDPCSVRVVAHVSRDTIDSFAVIWDDGSPKEVRKGNVFSHAYPIDAGAKTMTITAMARNGHGFWSEALTKQVPVRLGRPIVTAMRPDTVWVNDDTTFIVSANDTNGTIDSFMILWGDGTGLMKYGRTELINHKYDVFQYGVKTVKVLCRDDDGIFSDTAFYTIRVRLGKPVLSSITNASNADSIFIKDPLAFTVNYSDSNGTVDSISIDNGTGTFAAYQSVISVTQFAFNRTFASSETGSKIIRVRVKDRDGVLSDTVSKTMTVRLGAPRVDSIATAGVIWVRDINNFSINAFDTNGTLDSFEVDWNNDGTYESKSRTNAFSHVFDTTQYGNRPVSVRVMDNDTNWTTKALFVKVGLGRPILFGKTFGDSIQFVKGSGGVDTIFYVNHNNINSLVKVDTLDSNGRCVAYFWDWDANGTINATTTTTTTTDGFEEGQGRNLIVWCKDDDSLMSNLLRIYVYHDAPPSPITATSDAVTGGRKFSWSGLDAKDSIATEYRILVKRGGQPDTSASSADVAKDWTRADDPAFAYTPANTKPFTWTYTPTAGTGTYYFQIVSRDRRGTKSMGPYSYGNFEW